VFCLHKEQNTHLYQTPRQNNFLLHTAFGPVHAYQPCLFVSLPSHLRTKQNNPNNINETAYHKHQTHPTGISPIFTWCNDPRPVFSAMARGLLVMDDPINDMRIWQKASA
jgi:hypothetical protein